MVVTVRRRTGARNPNLPMSKVTIQKTGHAFEVSEGETVLAAALAAGITLPYGCRHGACGACKGKIVDGQVDYGAHQVYTLTDVELRVRCTHEARLQRRQLRFLGQIRAHELFGIEGPALRCCAVERERGPGK